MVLHPLGRRSVPPLARPEFARKALTKKVQRAPGCSAYDRHRGTVRATDAHFALLRRLLAAECGFAALLTGLAVVTLGVTPWAFAVLGVCLVPAMAVVDLVERRTPRE